MNTDESVRKGKIKPARIEWEMAAAIGICVILARCIPQMQLATACISVLLCMQDTCGNSWKSGITRMMITAIGGIIAVGIVLIQEFILDAFWMSVILTFIGCILTFAGCRAANVPMFSNRIGAVTFILVVFTKPGIERIIFAFQRLASTFAGILIVMAVAWVSQNLKGRSIFE